MDEDSKKDCIQLQKNFIKCYQNKKYILPECQNIITNYFDKCGIQNKIVVDKTKHYAILATH
jgi:hypothetical protein